MLMTRYGQSEKKESIPKVRATRTGPGRGASRTEDQSALRPLGGFGALVSEEEIKGRLETRKESK